MFAIPATAPAATGDLAKTPLVHLLVYVEERRLTGTLVFHEPSGERNAMYIHHGAPAKVWFHRPDLTLGCTVADAGHLDHGEIESAFIEAQNAGLLFGAWLLQEQIVTTDQLENVLTEHMARKFSQLALMESGTQYAFYDAVDLLAEYADGRNRPCDPLTLIWSGVRQRPPWDHISTTMTRVGNAGLKLLAHASPERFSFGKNELSLVARLAASDGMRISDLSNLRILGANSVQLIAYVLVITKQVELVELAAAPSSMRIPQAQASMQSTPSRTFPAVRPASHPSFGQLPASRPGHAASILRPGSKPSFSNMAAVNPGHPAADTPTSPVSVRSPAPGPIRYETPPPMSIRGLPGTRTASSSSLGAVLSPLGRSELPPSSGQSAVPFSSAPGSNRPRSMPPVAGMIPEHAAFADEIDAKAKIIGSLDFFAMLGLPHDADSDAVNKSYFDLARRWHPDRLPHTLLIKRDLASKVFSHFAAAHKTLSDPRKRADYMHLLKDGGATPDDQAEIKQALDGVALFQKAEFFFKRRDMLQAEQFAKQAMEADPTQADYVALYAWVSASKPENLGPDATRSAIELLNKAVTLNGRCVQAWLYRGMLYKRIGQGRDALKNFKECVNLNPDHVDAAREIRLHQMRGGRSVPPPSQSGSPAPPSTRPPASGGLFNKFFKK
jgi:DnaJ-domain-containing protein 1